MKLINKTFLIIIILFIGFWGCRKDYTQENFMKLNVEVTNTYSDKVTLKITGNYKSLPIEFGVCYSEDEEEPNIDNSKIAKFDSDSYVISNLQPQTTYYWRTFVKDLKRNEIIYGKVQTFTTEEGGDTPTGEVIYTWEIGYPNAKDVIAQLYNDGTLLISGSGAMKNFENQSYTPWNKNKDKLKKLIIKNGVTTIGDWAFINCNSFTGSLIIPNSVITIGGYAFAYCSGFTGNLIIPNSVTSIGNYAFQKCTGFTSLTIGNSVTTIGEYAFMDCNKLETINFNAINFTTMGIVFNGCTSLKVLNIGNQVQNIPNNAFAYCSGLTGNLTIPNSVTTIGNYAFYYCWGFIGNLIIPNSVTSIGAGAFVDCSGFTGNLSIPNSVTSIGWAAFDGCSGFTNLTIGNSVTSIGDYAFHSCDGLTSITVNAVVPPTLENYYVFGNVPKTIPVYVPCASLTAYQTASGWNYFTNYQCTTTSNDAKLANLSVSAGTLTPAFSSTTYNYNVNVANTVTSITITATTNHSQAIVSGDIGLKNLSVGENTFTITVTAEDGITKLNYNVIVTRAGTTVIDPEMVSVTGGTFTMGCTDDECGSSSLELPTHQVTLSSYKIGKYEVTQAQWQAVMGSNPSSFKGSNLPVEQVSWNDIVGTSGNYTEINGIKYYENGFIYKLNQLTGKQYRLPTEAEWEFAARGGTASAHYKYSGSNNINDVAWYSDNSGSTTHNVGTKQANELGIYDMSGNVYEWCSDWAGNYSSSSQTNPTGAVSGSYRISRGGGWYDVAMTCRVSLRGSMMPNNSANGTGFRLAL